MTDQAKPSDGDQVLTLQQLILARKRERGWSYEVMARRTGGRIGATRLNQLGTGKRVNEFPEPTTIAALADALEVSTTTVVLAAAASLGLDVRPRGPAFAQQLPAGVDELPGDVRDAVLATLRAAVAMLPPDDQGLPALPEATEGSMRWAPDGASSGPAPATTVTPMTARRRE